MAMFHYPKFFSHMRAAPPIRCRCSDRARAISIHGTEGTLIVKRGGCYVIPNPKSTITEVNYEKDGAMNAMNVPHWQNFIECIKTRAKPISDIETCVRSSTTCTLANLSMRHTTWLDWDEANWTVRAGSNQTLPQTEISRALETGSLNQ